jgi:hypothetical protein
MTCWLKNSAERLHGKEPMEYRLLIKGGSRRNRHLCDVG